jgi:integrase
MTKLGTRTGIRTERTAREASRGRAGIERLSALQVMRIVKARRPGRTADGGNLYLQIAGNNGTASWIFRAVVAGRERWIGLGGLDNVSLAQARKLAREHREQIAGGVDPLLARRARRAEAELKAARALTFDDCAEQFIASHEIAWRNPKHRQQWRNTLASYASPVFGAVAIQDVDTALVLKALTPLWLKKPETAGRLRGRVERIIDWAKARGFREGENPARWRGHLDHLLPARGKVRRVKHHAALAVDQVPAFLAALEQQDGVAALALRFAILTAARTGEVIGARWGEIDLAARLWRLPPQRMKSGREHRVPLAPPTLELLAQLREHQVDEADYLFPGLRPGKPISNMAMLVMLRRMGRGDITTHGFRSSFRNWAAERTNYSREVAEAALAHVVSDKTEAAYFRTDLFDKRRRLMAEWGKFCASPPAPSTGDVIPLGRSAS